MKLNVDAGRQIATVTKLFNGSNIEDLNNQTNGGIFSQLLHGEAFEENIDIDFLNLDKADYSKIYVVLDERRIPHLITQTDIYHRIPWNNLTENMTLIPKTFMMPNLSSIPGSFRDGSSPVVFLCLTHYLLLYKRLCLNVLMGMNRYPSIGVKCC